MKLAVYLGGTAHGTLKWVNAFEETVEIKEEVYRFAFGDDYIGVYYWKLNDFQVKAVRAQVIALRVRHGENVEDARNAVEAAAAAAMI
jgi:hypothetical protein